MKFLTTGKNWRIGGILAVAGIWLFGATVLAKDSTIQYPVKRIVRGMIMSGPPPSAKGRDVVLDVNEKLYHVTSRTVIVDENDQKTELNHFQTGGWVYMVVDLYADHREALFIAPISGPDQEPAQNPEAAAQP